MSPAIITLREGRKKVYTTPNFNFRSSLILFDLQIVIKNDVNSEIARTNMKTTFKYEGPAKRKSTVTKRRDFLATTKFAEGLDNSSTCQIGIRSQKKDTT